MNKEGEALKLLDVVALLQAIPTVNLAKGQVGTVVEELEEGVYEVEFADKQGRTITTMPMKAKDLMLLHFEIEALL